MVGGEQSIQILQSYNIKTSRNTDEFMLKILSLFIKIWGKRWAGLIGTVLDDAPVCCIKELRCSAKVSGHQLVYVLPLICGRNNVVINMKGWNEFAQKSGWADRQELPVLQQEAHLGILGQDVYKPSTWKIPQSRPRPLGGFELKEKAVQSLSTETTTSECWTWTNQVKV